MEGDGMEENCDTCPRRGTRVGCTKTKLDEAVKALGEDGREGGEEAKGSVVSLRRICWTVAVDGELGRGDMGSKMVSSARCMCPMRDNGDRGLGPDGFDRWR